MALPQDGIENKALVGDETKTLTTKRPGPPVAPVAEPDPESVSEPDPEPVDLGYVPEFRYAGCVGVCGDPDTEGCARIDVQSYQTLDDVDLAPEETVCVRARTARARIAAGVATASDQ